MAADIAIWQFDGSGVGAGLSVPTTIISGQAAMLQRFYIMLLTPLGSIRGHSSFGSPFLLGWYGGAVTEWIIKQRFLTAEAYIRTQMGEYESSDDTDECKYDHAEVEDVSVDAGGVITIRARIYTKAATSMPLKVKIAIG